MEAGRGHAAVPVYDDGAAGGCGRGRSGESTASVVMTGSVSTVDPAYAATPAERTLVLHLFDNLYRWTAEGAVPAAAHAYDCTDNEDGTQTYTVPPAARRQVVRRQRRDGGGFRVRLAAAGIAGDGQPRRRRSCPWWRAMRTPTRATGGAGCIRRGRAHLRGDAEHDVPVLCGRGVHSGGHHAGAAEGCGRRRGLERQPDVVRGQRAVPPHRPTGATVSSPRW